MEADGVMCFDPDPVPREPERATGRISIPALRENLDHSADECEGRCVTAFERREVLALVEAVETAQRVLDDAVDIRENDVKIDRHLVRAVLGAALARFDFGEEA